jgi:hypothetical protein
VAGKSSTEQILHFCDRRSLTIGMLISGCISVGVEKIATTPELRIELAPTGWPEAVTRLRLPQNPARGFPALGSSVVDSQFGDGLQLRVGEVELR